MEDNLLDCRCGCEDIQRLNTENRSFRIFCPRCGLTTEEQLEFKGAEDQWRLMCERHLHEHCSVYPTNNLRTLKDRHTGKRCFIVGSGPSILKMQLRMLKGEILLGANQVYRYYRNGLPQLSYWFIGDHTCLQKIRTDKTKGYDTENLGERFYRAGGFWVHVPYYPSANPYYVEDVQPLKEFKCDLTKPISHGNSITAESIAFAIYMGCDPIYIIGVDMDYKPGEPGFTDFDYSKAHQAHEKIREYCDKNFIEIYNAGLGGKLNAYERTDYRRVLSEKY